MKKAYVLLFAILSLILLAGCDGSSKELSGEESSGVVPIVSEEEIGSDAHEIEKINMYLKEYGYMPVFADISQIDDEWLVKTFYHYKFSPYDENTPPFSYQYIATIADIEETARKYINPDVRMNHEMDGSGFGNQWNSELKGFMFSPSGGMSVEYDYLDIDIDEQNDALYVSCIELRIEWDDEYMHENGTVYIGTDKVGTAKGDSSLGEIEYSFFDSRQDLEKKLFLLKENGYDETGYASKGACPFPLFVVDSKTAM